MQSQSHPQPDAGRADDQGSAPESHDSRERRWVTAARDGDAEAFARLVESYQDAIFRFAYRLTGSRETAEDVSQETFLKAYRSLSSFRGTAQFSTWLYQIARNACIDRSRRESRVQFESLEQPVETEGGEELRRQWPSEEEGPVDTVLRHEDRTLLQEMLQGLPEIYRTAVVLADVDGLSYKEIADVMDCPVGTVRSRLYRGRRALRDELRETERFAHLFVSNDDDSGEASD